MEDAEDVTDELEADNVNDGRVRDDDFLAELVMPFREDLAVPSLISY